MKRMRKRVEVNLEDLDRVLDQAREVPLSEPDYDKLKGALHALVEMLAKPRSTEKTSSVLEHPQPSPAGRAIPICPRGTDAMADQPLPAHGK